MMVSLFISLILMAIKFTAFWITGSNAILTDAVESIVNVTAGSFALFSIYYAQKPADEDHPYGHGKIEYLSSGFEGTLIALAGITMVIKGFTAFYRKDQLSDLDLGIYLTAFAGLVNFIVGKRIQLKGIETHSVLMQASGKHLISDSVSSLGLVVGLALVYITGDFRIDYVIAILFGAYIFYMGFKIMRESVFNLLDKTDYSKVEAIIRIVNHQRKENWIDIHNLRILKYGAVLHIDCHVTLPWYLTIDQAHAEVTLIEQLVKEEFDQELEFFIHADPCLPNSCSICLIKECSVRKHPFSKKIEWQMKNILPNRKHSAET
jgi:cation diffusion facilitator family transporter